MTKIERGKLGISIGKFTDFYEVHLIMDHGGTAIGTFDYEGFRSCDARVLVPREFGDSKTFDEIVDEAYRRWDIIKPLL